MDPTDPVAAAVEFAYRAQQQLGRACVNLARAKSLLRLSRRRLPGGTKDIREAIDMATSSVSAAMGYVHGVIVDREQPTAQAPLRSVEESKASK